jgi:hypothetical protein
VEEIFQQSIRKHSYNQGKAEHIDITLSKYDQLNLSSLSEWYSAVYGACVDGRAIHSSHKLK